MFCSVLFCCLFVFLKSLWLLLGAQIAVGGRAKVEAETQVEAETHVVAWEEVDGLD